MHSYFQKKLPISGGQNHMDLVNFTKIQHFPNLHVSIFTTGMIKQSADANREDRYSRYTTPVMCLKYPHKSP